MKKIIWAGCAALLMVAVIFAVVSAHGFGETLAGAKELVTDYSDGVYAKGAALKIEFEAAASVDLREEITAGGEFSLTIDAPSDGFYNVVMEWTPKNRSFERNLADITVNGTLNGDCENVVLPSRFVFVGHDSPVNAKGVEIYPDQEMLAETESRFLRVGQGEYRTDALAVWLNKGENIITVAQIEGAAAFRRVYIVPVKEDESYTQYAARFPKINAGALTVLEAEKFYYKNGGKISVTSASALNVSPYDTNLVFLNAIDPKSFGDNMDRLAYYIDIAEEGFYEIGLKTAMPGKAYMPVYIDVEIDGSVPFAEFRGATLPYIQKQANHLFKDFPVYFSKGVHEVAFVINAGKYYELSAELKRVTAEISELGLDLQKITGNSQDRNREWVIADFLPNMASDMEGWVSALGRVESALLELSGGKSNEEIQKIRLSRTQLNKLIKEPNTTPYRMSLLTQGSNSAFQLLSSAALTINVQSLTLDQIIVKGVNYNGGMSVTRDSAAFAVSEMFKRLGASYEAPPADKSDAGTIDVWFRRARQYYDVAQTLTDSYFTAQTGINVNLTLVSDQGALALANAAGRQPDVMVNADDHYVNDLAVRGSLTDLRQFDGVNGAVGNASAGAMLQLVIDDKLYGLPESQTFYVMFYRKDIFDKFGWGVPDTWDDVLLLLPQLQRAGMNFYTPLASTDALKSWAMTMPFYSAFGADVYAPDGLKTIIDGQNAIAAMRFMTELFKIYGMPQQVASFYNDFRSGRIPIGVADFGSYTQLAYGAQEIAGLWEIAPVPGFANESGEIERWSAGPCGAVCIFEKSNKKQESWKFVEWWLSDFTQYEFMDKLQSMYGKEFLWPSGNLNVLKQMPIPKRHLEVIAEQVEWIKQAPRIPGGYFTEREVSNAFTKIVYEDADVKTAVDDAATIANREIKRKLEEFGYVGEKGEVLKPYIVPTIEEIRGWGR